MKETDIRLTPIKNGTVLDHLPVGTALKILEALQLSKPEKAVTIAINTESKRMGKKDLVFIEGKELTKSETEKIGLLAKGATINLIQNSEVKNKTTIELPEKAIGIIKCLNPKCISTIEGLETRFCIEQEPLRAKCFYCEKTMHEKEIANAIK
ncbi:MAG: aspartate carbamoyltransferase regulatory subunit [Candidatus ainarchaeum sp.]|nr:aspartate carbamoyltransferase regulatory subunit [Candidatus ainarchaeum sp.]